MATPGHSPGSMSVIVKTAKGTYGILGDLIAFLECWERNPKIPNGFLTNLEATYESFAKLERVIDFALPGHEPRLLEHKSYPV
jgi:glyoxylase-like metal-dependent hydrolase (beta-lactamase superfamily II)